MPRLLSNKRSKARLDTPIYGPLPYAQQKKKKRAMFYFLYVVLSICQEKVFAKKKTKDSLEDALRLKMIFIRSRTSAKKKIFFRWFWAFSSYLPTELEGLKHRLKYPSALFKESYLKLIFTHFHHDMGVGWAKNKWKILKNTVKLFVAIT